MKKFIMMLMLVTSIMAIGCKADERDHSSTPNDRALSKEIKLLKCSLNEPFVYRHLGVSKTASVATIVSALYTHKGVTKGLMRCVSLGYKWKQRRLLAAVRTYMTD